MHRPWTLTVATGLISVLLLGGCATTQETVLPQDGKPMKQIYEEHFAGIAERSVDSARAELRRGPGNRADRLRGYVREAQTEIDAIFPRLPNPTLVMFVFPHLAGREAVPVPGYATSFPMYERVEYALPGEVPGRGAD